MCAEQAREDRERERANLKAQVDAQGLSDHEIQKLTADRHQLDEAYRLTSAKLHQVMQLTLNDEVELARTFNQIEKLTELYHGLATKLGLLPTGPEGYEGINFAQELNGGAHLPQAVVPDCTSMIRPAVVQMKQTVTKKRHQDGDRILQLEDEISKLAERLQDLSESVEEAEARYEVVTNELTASKDVCSAARSCLLCLLISCAGTEPIHEHSTCFYGSTRQADNRSE